MKSINVKSDESVFYNSPVMDINPDQRYLVKVSVSCEEGQLGAAYLCVIILDEKKEISRVIKWIKNSSGIEKEYELNFQTPKNSKKIIVGYRINFETPNKSEVKMAVSDPLDFVLQETESGEDIFDDITKYEVPELPPLTQEQEDVLEKKIVWIFGVPRSGTTWLGTRLLNHPENIIWDESWLGYHLATLVTSSEAEKMNPQQQENIAFPYSRIFDVQSINGNYFFAPHHKKNWLPYFRKLILARVYSQAQTLTKNIIIKDSPSVGGADIIMEAFPKAKLIFLLRDGRDVVESRIDMHSPDSWGRLPPIKAEEKGSYILYYSEDWKFFNDKIEKAYNNHDENVRFFIKYEELKKDTFSIVKKLYQFIDVKIYDSEIKELVDFYDFKNIPESEKGPGKFNRAATTGGWKKSFAKDEQNYMNEVMGPMLKKFGYEV